MNAVVSRRVVKLGGSLLDHNPLASEFLRWLGGQSRMANLIVVGGGRPIDAIRRESQLGTLDDRSAHWSAIEAMLRNADSLAQRLSLPPPRSLEQILSEPATPGCTVVDPWRFVRDEEPRLAAEPLPESWDVTSDSIAARLALVCAARELVLLKSSLPPRGSTPRMASTSGYVDRYFPMAAAGVTSIRCVNLRDAEFPEITLAG